MVKKKATAPEPVQIAGYRRKPRFRWLEYRPEGLEEDEEAFRVRIRTNLTFAESNAIPFGIGTKFQDIFVAIAPYVIEWNALGFNVDSGEMEAVPPPAEAGPDAFLVLDQAEVLWLANAVKFGYLGGEDRKKELTPPDSMDEP